MKLSSQSLKWEAEHSTILHSLEESSLSFLHILPARSYIFNITRSKLMQVFLLTLSIFIFVTIFSDTYYLIQHCLLGARFFSLFPSISSRSHPFSYEANIKIFYSSRDSAPFFCYLAQLKRGFRIPFFGERDTRRYE